MQEFSVHRQINFPVFNYFDLRNIESDFIPKLNQTLFSPNATLTSSFTRISSFSFYKQLSFPQTIKAVLHEVKLTSR